MERATRDRPRRIVDEPDRQPEVSIEVLEHALSIDEHNLEHALLSQPDSFYRVAKMLALETSRRDAAKHGHAEAEAKAEIRARHDAEVDGHKITVSEVDAEKQLDRDVKRAQEQLLDLNRRVADLAALKEAFIQRSYMLRELCGLYVANYYGGNIETKVSGDMKNVDARRAKDAMAREREKRRQT